MLTALAARTALYATAAALAGAGASTVTRRKAARREAEAEAAFPPQGEVIDVTFQGRTVPVHAVVRGAGPDLVLIHGASGNLRDWTFAFADRMADRFRVIALDRPGLGYTGRTDPGYDHALSSAAESPADQAGLLCAACRALGADRPLVVGHSFGGAVALAWAVHHPQAVRGLVLVAAASNRWKGGLGPLYAVNASALGGAAVVPLLTAFAPDRRLEDITRAIFAPDPVPPGYDAHVGAQLTLRRSALRANARQVNGLKPYIVEMERHYPALTLPIESIHGTADTIVPAAIHAEPFARMVPQTNLTLLDGIGHMPHHAAPEAVEAAILRAHDRSIRQSGT